MSSDLEKYQRVVHDAQRGEEKKFYQRILREVADMQADIARLVNRTGDALPDRSGASIHVLHPTRRYRLKGGLGINSGKTATKQPAEATVYRLFDTASQTNRLRKTST